MYGFQGRQNTAKASTSTSTNSTHTHTHNSIKSISCDLIIKPCQQLSQSSLSPSTTTPTSPSSPTTCWLIAGVTVPCSRNITKPIRCRTVHNGLPLVALSYSSRSRFMNFILFWDTMVNCSLALSFQASCVDLLFFWSCCSLLLEYSEMHLWSPGTSKQRSTQLSSRISKQRVIEERERRREWKWMVEERGRRREKRRVEVVGEREEGEWSRGRGGGGSGYGVRSWQDSTEHLTQKCEHSFGYQSINQSIKWD